VTTAVRSTCGLGNADWNLGLGVIVLRSQMSLPGKQSQFPTNFFLILTIYTYRGDVRKFIKHQYKINLYTKGLITVR
jgi:hypothetical protein